jgi:hypothetical protein
MFESHEERGLLTFLGSLTCVDATAVEAAYFAVTHAEK